MNYHVELFDTHVLVRFRVAQDGLVGDAEETVYPGEEIFGLTYQQLRERGSGEFQAD